MPLRNAILREAFISSVIAKVIKETLLHVCSFRIGMNIANCIQRPLIIRYRKAVAVIALFPKVSRAIEQSVKAHGTVPIQPVHNFRQILRLRWRNQVMNMVAHNAQRIQPKAILRLTFLNHIQQHLLALKAIESKLSVIAPYGDVIATTGLELTRLSGHCSTFYGVRGEVRVADVIPK